MSNKKETQKEKLVQSIMKQFRNGMKSQMIQMLNPDTHLYPGNVQFKRSVHDDSPIVEFAIYASPDGRIVGSDWTHIDEKIFNSFSELRK